MARASSARTTGGAARERAWLATLGRGRTVHDKLLASSPARLTAHLTRMTQAEALKITPYFTAKGGLSVVHSVLEKHGAQGIAPVCAWVVRACDLGLKEGVGPLLEALVPSATDRSRAIVDAAIHALDTFGDERFAGSAAARGHAIAILQQAPKLALPKLRAMSDRGWTADVLRTLEGKPTPKARASNAKKPKRRDRSAWLEELEPLYVPAADRTLAKRGVVEPRKVETIVVLPTVGVYHGLFHPTDAAFGDPDFFVLRTKHEQPEVFLVPWENLQGVGRRPREGGPQRPAEASKKRSGFVVDRKRWEARLGRVLSATSKRGARTLHPEVDMLELLGGPGLACAFQGTTLTTAPEGIVFTSDENTERVPWTHVEGLRVSLRASPAAQRLAERLLVNAFL